MSRTNAHSTFGTTDDARYIFLENAVSRKNATRMLGAVVPAFYKTRPYDHYRPNWRDPALRPTIDGKANEDRERLEDTMNEIWTDAGQPVPLQDVLARKKLATGHDTHLKFTSLLAGLFHKERSEEIEIRSGEVKFYSFDDPGPNLSDLLLACEPWKRQVEKLVNEVTKEGGYYIVTGVAVVKDAEVSWIEKQENTKAVATKVPGEVLNALTQGVPPIAGPVARAADVEVKWQKVAQEGSQVFARCLEEIIVAIKYDELDVVYESDSDLDSSDDALKKPGLFSRLSSFMRPKKPSDTAARPGSSDQNATAIANGTGFHTKRKLRKIASASLGLPIRGNGFNSAFGSEDSGSTSSLNSDDDERRYSDHLTVGKERDVFSVAKAPYIRAEDGARVFA